MKKLISIRRKIAAMVLLLLLALTGIRSEAAEAVIIGLEPNESNLFSGMGDLMPGETRTDYIVLKNVSRWDATFFLIAESAGEADFDSKELWEVSERLLEQLELRVVLHQTDSASNINGAGSVLYEGKAHQRDGENALIGRSVRLADLQAGKRCVIEISVTVPEGLSNEHNGAEGRFWWKFVSYADDGAVPPPVNPGPDPDVNPEPEPGTKPGTSEPEEEPGVEPGSEPEIIRLGSIDDDYDAPDGLTYPENGDGGNLSAFEGTAEPEETLVQIAQERIPLIDFGRRGGWSLLNLVLSILALIGAMTTVMNTIAPDKKDEEDASEDEQKSGPWTRNHRLLQALAFLSGILPIICFLLLEDFSYMQILSRWSPLIVGLVCLEILSYVLIWLHQRNAQTGKDKEEKTGIA